MAVYVMLGSFIYCHKATAQTVSDTIVITAEPVPVTADTPKMYNRLNKTYFKSIGSDFVHVATRPAHWKAKDWGKFFVITGSAGALMLTDGDIAIKRMFQRNQKHFFSQAGRVIEPFGNHYPPLLITGMYLTGLITGNRRVEDLSLSVARSVVISTAFYASTKKLIRRQRPVRTENPLLFGPPFTSNTNGFTSFPSGHANTIFSIATAFSEEFKETKWVPWAAYTVATLTSVTRMYQNRHWASDIIVGAAIGHFVTKTVYKVENRKKAKRLLQP